MLKSFEKKYPDIIRLILNKENSGFGKANNQGVKIAKSKYILLLNSDTVTLNNAIEKLFNYFKENENLIHFVGAKLYNKDMTEQPSAAPFFTIPVVFAALFLKGDYWGLTRSSPNISKKITIKLMALTKTYLCIWMKLIYYIEQNKRICIHIFIQNQSLYT